MRSIVRDLARMAGLRSRFEALVGALERGLQRTFPEGVLRVVPSVVFLERPSRAALARLSPRAFREAQPTLRHKPRCYHRADRGSPYYSLWDCYFEDTGVWTDLEIRDALLTGAWTPPAALLLEVWEVVDADGARLCDAQTIGAHSAEFAGVPEVAALDFARESVALPEIYGWAASSPADSQAESGSGGELWHGAESAAEHALSAQADTCALASDHAFRGDPHSSDSDSDFGN